jgi:hypothetical protein
LECVEPTENTEMQLLPTREFKIGAFQLERQATAKTNLKSDTTKSTLNIIWADLTLSTAEDRF